MLLYSVVSMLVLYALQRLQGHLPFNPQHLPGVDSAGATTGGYVGSSFNTAASFTTNTNWQSYGGETTITRLRQPRLRAKRVSMTFWRKQRPKTR